MSKNVSYKIQNWSTYNRALINRGNITLWFSNDVIDGWVAGSTGKRGRPTFYSDQVIILALTLKSLYGLPLRATQGFLEGLLSLMGLELPVPDYTRLCRRGKDLKINYRSSNKSKNLDLVIDSTGLKVYGEGEWKMKIHGKDKRRTWRKLHLAANPDTFEIVAVKLTESNKHDGKIMPKLLNNFSSLNKVYADAAYMEKDCFDAIDSRGGTALIDLRSGTSLAKNPSGGLKQRNQIVREIWKVSDKKEWKVNSGYHRRSLVETQMFRFKKILGGHLSARLMASQTVEAQIKCSILNKMSSFGMPKTKAFKI
jgi:IS5 family transposase